MKKLCSSCGDLKPTSDFRTSGRNYSNYCATCRGEESHQPQAATRQAPEPRTTSELIEEHKNKQRIRILESEKRQLIYELDQEKMRSAVFDSITPDFIQLPSTLPYNSAMREATAVVLCSDWHVEEPVDPVKVNGLNEYDLNIAAKRINKLTEGILWLIEMHRSKFHIDNLVIWLGGDLFSGHIHEELMEETELSPVESILWLQEHIGTMIETVLDRTDLNLTIPCSYGNHGRTTRKSRISTGAENSYEWMMYQQMARIYESNPRVTFVAPKSQIVYIKVYDFTLRFTHGDAIKYAGGVGGPFVSYNKAINGWNRGRNADVTCIGHFHTYKSLPHGVINGSLIGYGPYSVRIKAEHEPPQQAFFLMDSRRGKCCATPIWVE